MSVTIDVAILGMGRVGASIGLAVKRYNESKRAEQHFRITAYDPFDSNMTAAREKGAYDQVSRGVYDAARDKALIVIALPYSYVQRAYRDIAAAARPGTVIMDVSPLKTPSLAWADKLPDGVYMVGATPIFNAAYLFDGLDDTAHAQVDLFDKGGMLLMPRADCPPEAVELVSDFCMLIGAFPRYADPNEHDGWAAAVEGLPMLLGLASFYTVMKADGWRDAQQQAGHSFGRLTHHLFDTHADDLRDTLLNNRDNLVRQIDSLTETLNGLRETLVADDRDALEAMLEEVTDAFHVWLHKRRDNQWEKPSAPPRPEIGAHMGNLIFGAALSKRLRGDKDKP